MIAQDELSIGLTQTSFDMFEKGIKRFGYCNDPTDDCLKAVIQYTKLDPKVFDQEDSITYAYFRHPSCYDHGRYFTPQLLKLGFLFCG